MSLQGCQLPAATKRVIIFDTNAYRVLAHGMTLNDARVKALQLRRCEQSAGVFIVASPVTVWELITHLADPADPALPHCLNALVMLGEHALSPGASKRRDFSFRRFCESTVCRELFRR